MEIDFTKFRYKDINGDIQELDISKHIGNYIYNETTDLGELDLAQRIYKEGKIDINQNEIDIIRRYLEKGYKAFIQKAFNDLTTNN